MKQVLYERLVQYILENQERFYRVAYSYTRHQEDAYYEKGYEQDDDLEKELDSLEPDVQEIIKLRFFEEMSLKYSQ